MEIDSQPEISNWPGWILSKILKICLAIYAFALPLSMGGMEIFSWLSFLIFIIIGALYFYKNKEFIYIKSSYEWPLIGYWIIVILGAIFADNLNTNEFIFVIGGPRWIILFLVFYSIFKNNLVDRELILKIMVISCLVVSIYGIYQSQTGIDLFRSTLYKPTVIGNIAVWRTKGFFSNPMTFANSLSIAFCFLYAFQVIGKGFQKTHMKFITYVTLCTIASALLTTFTRGVWFGVFLTLFIITTLYKKIYGVFFLLIFIIFFYFLYNESYLIKNRITNIFATEQESVSDRVDVWRAHWAMFKDYPLLGVGLNMTKKRIQEYHIKIKGEPGFYSHAHNNILQVLASTGILGFIFLSSFFYKLFLVFFKGIYQNKYIYALFAILLCLNLSGLTEANFFDGEVLHMFIFLLALSLTTNSNNSKLC